MSEWERELNEVRKTLKKMGWETLFDEYYIQGEITETYKKGDKYLHIAYGDLEDILENYDEDKKEKGGT